jgi:non-ribosomal peptide synthetase component E (peptide arylation enzyme)
MRTSGNKNPRKRKTIRLSKIKYEEKIVQVKRVTKVVKGGKKMTFRAIVIIGDNKRKVGVGIGRADDVVISGGANVSLTSIEIELAANFPCVKFLATAIADSEWGQKICLISDYEIDEDQVSQVLKNNLGKQFVPKEFLVVQQIPEIGIGKPDRVKASQLFLDKQR